MGKHLLPNETTIETHTRVNTKSDGF